MTEVEALARGLTDEQWEAVFRSLVEGGGAGGMGPLSWHQAKALLAYVRELASSPLMAEGIRNPHGCSLEAFHVAEKFGAIEHDGTFRVVGFRKDKRANWNVTPLGRAVLRVLEANDG